MSLLIGHRPECAPSLVTLLPAVSAVLVVTVTLAVPVSVTSLATLVLQPSFRLCRSLKKLL